jgi:hypothetical protein
MRGGTQLSNPPRFRKSKKERRPYSSICRVFTEPPAWASAPRKSCISAWFAVVIFLLPRKRPKLQAVRRYLLRVARVYRWTQSHFEKRRFRISLNACADSILGTGLVDSQAMVPSMRESVQKSGNCFTFQILHRIVTHNRSVRLQYWLSMRRKFYVLTGPSSAMS